MQRRDFLTLPSVAGAALAAPKADELPKYRVQSSYKAAAQPGMPGPFPGRVVNVHAAKSISPETDKVDPAAVAEMMKQGMLALTGDKDLRDSWRRFIQPNDVVGIKLNCSGAPKICSHPVVVAEIAKQLIAIGVPARNITCFERFKDQIDTVKYPQYLPEGVNVWAASSGRDAINGYDPRTYVEVDFFGEDDTRSNLVRPIAERFTKIINVPNMKDHGASGVTGCLKNIAYGSFHNVARSHRFEKTNTFSFIGTLAAVEPLRSRTVLQIMDGLKGVWHGGPFLHADRFKFYPARMMFGTDPVAIDRLLTDIIEEKRKAEGAISVFNRSMDYVKKGDFRKDPNTNNFVREPGHIEFAGGLGLGVFDKSKITLKEITL
ncbi:MAG: DUF362 domain-containing protein [Bryobacterales bacterium]|nr:DUF362 domain-containing protein [Bryobacterales bacterium]